MLQSLRKRAAVVGGVLTTLVVGAMIMAGPASAEPPADPVADAFGDITDKVGVYSGLLVTLVVAVVLALFGIAWIRKARSAGK